jgi:hypothetical protein
MAVAAGVLNDMRRRTLAAICDTHAPSGRHRQRGHRQRKFFPRARLLLGHVCTDGGIVRAGCGVWIGDASAFPTAPGSNSLPTGPPPTPHGQYGAEI